MGIYESNTKLAKAAETVEKAWAVVCEENTKMNFLQPGYSADEAMQHAKSHATYNVVERFVNVLRDGKQRRANFENMVDGDEFFIVQLVAMSAK